jgi:hypothetical protein
MMANIGVIIGPMLGGLTADPAANYPSLFGGIPFLEKFPYCPPNLISAIFLACAALGVFFGLEEVSFLVYSKAQSLTNLDARTICPSKRYRCDTASQSIFGLPIYL